MAACGGGGGSDNGGGGGTPQTYTVGGTLTGLVGTGLVLQNNGGEDLSVPANGTTFTFATSAVSGTAYSVTIKSQPSAPTQVCKVTSASGMIASSNVTNVAVSCDPAIALLAGALGGLGQQDGSSATARFYDPTGIATDAMGDVYVADSQNSTIRKVTRDGVVSTLAGQSGKGGYQDGDALSARFNNPQGVTVDSMGNVYVADIYNHAIRRISPQSVVTTIAGAPGTIEDVLGPLPGSLNAPASLAVLPGTAVRLVLTDQNEDAILQIALP